MSETKIPYGAAERDLTRLVDERVTAAIHSVFQLTEGTGQAVLLGVTAVSMSAAFAGAAFAAHYGKKPEDIDAIDVGISMLEATKNARGEPSAVPGRARGILEEAKRYRATPTYSAADLTSRLGEVAQAIAFQAGEPESEIAGMILSTLVKRPELIDRFMAEGSGLLVDGEIGPLTGCLSYRAIDGTIRRPEDATAARAPGGDHG